MTSHPIQSKWRPQFGVSTLLLLILLVAFFLACRARVERAERELASQEYKLRFFERELDRARDDLAQHARSQPNKSQAGRGTEFDGAHLREVTIACPGGSLQYVSFRDCQLENSALTGGPSAFQLARFDRSKLLNAKLAGGAASFQSATFVEADLTNAVLVGGANSFDGVSFESAKLVNASLTGSFYSINISGARFEGADLSALDADSLASGYFKDPPVYDGKTKFPANFDPQKHLWRRAADRN